MVRIFLRNGIAHATFSDVVKKMFVEVGYEEIIRQGKKQTVSNVSILTGINRKEVARLKGALAVEEDLSLKKFNRIVRVIAGWQHDEKFLDESHEPLDLQLEGEHNSFTALIKTYSGDMPVVAMLNALLDAGNIEVLDNGLIQLVKPNYLPLSDPEEKLNILGIDTAEFIETIDHNIVATEKEDLWFQRKASNTQVNKNALAKIHKKLEKKAQQLLEDVDADFSENETDFDAQKSSVSVGIFFNRRDKSGSSDQ